MADRSVFEMSGPAREKLAALQSISQTDRSSTYDQELSKIVCSFMKPLADAKVSGLRTPTIGAEGSSDSESKPLPFNLVKPAESWSEVGVRTVADLKSVMNSKGPEQNLQISDRGVDWRLRSSLYANFQGDRRVRLSYRIPGLEERADSPPLNLDSCTNLTSGQVLDAMKVLSPPIKLTACKPYTSPKRNTQPRPEGKLPLNNLPISVPSTKKSQIRSFPPQPVMKPKPATTGKARMKFTKRRSDLEKDPLTGLLEPHPYTGHSEASSSTGSFLENFDMPIGVPSENNNTIYFDNYCREILQELKPEYTSPSNCAEGNGSTVRLEPYLFEEGSIAPVFPETIEHASRTGIDETMSDSFHDKYLQPSAVITTDRQQPAEEFHQVLRKEPQRGLQQMQQQIERSQRLDQQQVPQQPSEPVGAQATDATIEDIDDVEFFEIVVADHDRADEMSLTNEPKRPSPPGPPRPEVVAPSDAKAPLELVAPTITQPPLDSTSSNEDLLRALVPMFPIFSDDYVHRADDTAQQTQQSVSIRGVSSSVTPSPLPKPKPIKLFELYQAVTELKTPKLFPAPTRNSQKVNQYLVRGQLALPAPEGMLT